MRGEGKGKRVRSEGLTIWKFAEGRGRAVVALHGFMGSGRDWGRVAELAGVQVIAPDLPGHGESVFEEPQRFSMRAAAERVIGVLDELEIERCIGMGYSMGGRLLLYMAVHYFERFSYLILESTSPGLATQAERMQRKQWDLLMAERLRKMPFEDFLRQWYAMPLFETFRQHPGFERAFARRLENDPAQLALSMERMGTGSMASLWEAWARLEVPSLLVVGGHDAKYRRIAREMVQLNERAALAVVEEVGHNVHFEDLEGFLDVIRPILHPTTPQS